MLATVFANCVEEPSTCVQEGPTPVAASDPSSKKFNLSESGHLLSYTTLHSIIVTIYLCVAFLISSTRPTSTFQPSPLLLPSNLLENLSSYILIAALGIGIFIFILFIISCLYRYKRRKAFLHGFQPEEIIGRLHCT